MTDVKRRNGKISGKTGNSGRKHKVTFHSFIYILQCISDKLGIYIIKIVIPSMAFSSHGCAFVPVALSPLLI